MILTREKPNGTQLIDTVQSKGSTAYVKDGKLYKNAPINLVLVASSSDLPLLYEFEPGTIAYTAGFATMWQKSPAGEWAEME